MKKQANIETVDGQTSLWATGQAEDSEAGPGKKDQAEEQKSMEDKLSLKDYDQGIQELEAIVHRLEQEELSLEENIKLYEKGVRLHKELEGILKTQEGKVLEIKEGASQALEINFEVE